MQDQGPCLCKAESRLRTGHRLLNVTPEAAPFLPPIAPHAGLPPASRCGRSTTCPSVIDISSSTTCRHKGNSRVRAAVSHNAVKLRAPGGAAGISEGLQLFTTHSNPGAWATSTQHSAATEPQHSTPSSPLSAAPGAPAAAPPPPPAPWPPVRPAAWPSEPRSGACMPQSSPGRAAPRLPSHQGGGSRVVGEAASLCGQLGGCCQPRRSCKCAQAAATRSDALSGDINPCPTDRWRALPG